MTRRSFASFGNLSARGLAIATAALFSLTPAAEARVTTLTIANTQPAFVVGNQATSFGPVGTYEVITGTFTDEVDPNDPLNSVITDIALGPKNANGTVSFTADFHIIKPTHL